MITTDDEVEWLWPELDAAKWYVWQIKFANCDGTIFLCPGHGTVPWS